LSGIHDLDEIERRAEEERRQELVAEELEAAAEARRAEQRDLENQLEALMLNYLREEIAEELGSRKKPSAGLNKRSREDFKRFREHCAKLDLPHLPASPPTVAAFLTSELDKGRPHLRRLIKLISATHKLADLNDPTSDLLIRALLRLARDEPQQKEGN
jgi:hypothetical protein